MLPKMPSSESSSCSDTTDSHQVWTDSDEEEEVSSHRIIGRRAPPSSTTSIGKSIHAMEMGAAAMCSKGFEQGTGKSIHAVEAGRVAHGHKTGDGRSASSMAGWAVRQQ